MDLGVHKLCFIGVPNKLALKMISRSFGEICTPYIFPLLGMVTPVTNPILEIEGHSIKVIIAGINSDPAFTKKRGNLYGGAIGAVFLYDQGKFKSFEAIKQIIAETKEQIGNEGIYTLIGVETEEAITVTKQGERLATEMGVMFKEIKETDQNTVPEIVKLMVRNFVLTRAS